MIIKKEDEEKIVNFGAFEYDAQKMSNILDVDIAAIEAQMKDKSSQFSLLYQKGVDMSDYVIDQKLFEMAQQGDLKALKEFEKRKRLKNL